MSDIIGYHRTSMSFIKIRNKSGARMEPWGTPEFVNISVDS
jgi:hypothetical protein